MNPEPLAHGDVVELFWQPFEPSDPDAPRETFVAVVLETDFRERDHRPLRIRPLFPMAQGHAMIGDLRYATRWLRYEDLKRRIPDHEAEHRLGHPRPQQLPEGERTP